MKPEFLYHGSQYLFETLIPQQSNDQTEIGSQLAIYACEYINLVIPFLLPIRWYPDPLTSNDKDFWYPRPCGKGHYSCNTDGGALDNKAVWKTVVEYGSIDPNGFGYVYKISSEYFEKMDSWQWVTKKEVRPIEVIKIMVADYWHTVSFTNETLEINKSLYPSDTLYLNIQPRTD
jgi:hypothetical protein